MDKLLGLQISGYLQSKRLKELGVAQKSLFFWTRNEHHPDSLPESQPTLYDEEHSRQDLYEFSAYTTGELGLLLSAVEYKAYGFPVVYTVCHLDGGLISEANGKWDVFFRNAAEFSNPKLKPYSACEAHVRAQMLIWLLENGHITADKINHVLLETV